TYYALNNEINIPVNDQIPLNKDKEALQAFLTENVAPNTMKFASLQERLKYLVEHHYYEADFLKKYQPAFLEKLNQFLTAQHFQFKSFMAAYKYYAQYALKTDDGT
ncbi:ribonucleotide-diphosphate reductase subunit alpha, partial [Streptococcus anginosus]|nr:ribonucleotide-diphosphate reductase subunit alpha [Streptococcus anginosus]